MSAPDPDTRAQPGDTAPPDATAPTPSTPPGAPPPGAPASPAPRPARRRLADALVYLAVPLMVLALLDPLEGGVVSAVLAIPLAGVAFTRHSRARWALVAGLILYALAFAYMSVAGQVASVLQNAALLPWMAAVLVTVAGGLWLLRQVLAERHPRAATIVPVVLALVGLAFSARVVVLLGEYRPWDVAMSERASVDGPNVRLSLELEDGPFAPDAGYWGAAVLENRGAGPLALPPKTLLNVVLRDTTGQVTWDGARAYYGPVPPVMPWTRTTVIGPGDSARRPWALLCSQPGDYQATAEIVGGPFDGLATGPVPLRCAGQP